MTMDRNSGGTPLWAKLTLGAGVLLVAGIAAGMFNESRVPDLDKEDATDALHHPKPGDVLLFYRPRRGRDYFIRWFTRSPFYHAAIFAGDEHVIEARPAGVGKNSIADREGDYVVAPAPDGKGAAALAWAQTQIGDAFDNKDFFVIALEHIFVGWHINYAPPGRYSCAGFVTDAFVHSGFTPFPGRLPDEISPSDWARYLPAPYNTAYGKG
jgi:hypothetical protein